MTFKEWAKDRPGMTPHTMAYIVAEGAWDAANDAEREACAKLCEAKANENADKLEGDEAKAMSWMMLHCAALIRKRYN